MTSQIRTIAADARRLEYEESGKAQAAPFTLFIYFYPSFHYHISESKYDEHVIHGRQARLLRL